jgi:predicted porin
MLKQKKLSMAVAGALALAGASTANAGIGFKAGEWDVDFSGNVNGFATYNDCATKNLPTIAGGLACNQPTGTKQSTTSIESGLLPSALVFSAKSRQMNMDVGVTIGVYPTIRTFGAGTGEGFGSNNNGALGVSSLNIRQNFLTFGDASWGNFKIGRDLGLFGSDAILSDMTLLGVGSGAAFLGGNTTLGRIGVGYIYADWLPQISYTSPSFYGVQAAAGMFQTFSTFNSITGFDPNAATLAASRTPAWQAKLSYDSKFDVGSDQLAFKAWTDYMYNAPSAGGGTFTTNGGAVPAGLKADGWAWDIGAKAGFYGFELLGYYYYGDGVGTTGIGSQAVSYVCPSGAALCPGGAGASLEKRNSNGGYAQLTYKWQDLKVGYSYGQSELKLAGNERLYANGFDSRNPNMIRYNTSNVIGVYYALTKSLNLVGEWINTESKNQNGDKYNDNAFALGAILFF